jgi:hypothetical protein
LVKALGKEGWETVTIGKAPAAKKIATEMKEPDGEGESKEPVEVQTNSYVGCNGATKWVLTVSMSSSKKARFDPLAKKIVDSIAYAK